MNILLLLSSFLFMEFVAWSNHKYVMHGFLWKWHKDHHINDKRDVLSDDKKLIRFEKNDIFFLIYAIPAIIMISIGFQYNIPTLIFIGAGITLYGLTYFIIHDVIIHKRFGIKFLSGTHSKYLKAVVNAHLAHHRPKSSGDFNNFGLLIFSKKYFNV